MSNSNITKTIRIFRKISLLKVSYILEFYLVYNRFYWKLLRSKLEKLLVAFLDSSLHILEFFEQANFESFRYCPFCMNWKALGKFVIPSTHPSIICHSNICHFCFWTEVKSHQRRKMPTATEHLMFCG